MAERLKKLNKDDYLAVTVKVEANEPKAERRPASEIRAALYGKDK